MNWFLREFRLLPVVLLATASLLVLKTLGIMNEGGYVLGSPHPVQAQEAHPSAGGSSTDHSIVTGAVPDSKPSGKATDAKDKPAEKANAESSPATKNGDAAKTKPSEAAKDKNGAPAPNQAVVPAAVPSGTSIPLDTRPLSPAERAILERLQDRRLELEKRARELDMRESLIAAAEKRLEAHVAEMKDLEARINAAMHKRDEAEAARFKSLVSMYQNMKPKDAAKIFDRLDPKVLIEVAGQINPRQMSEILAQMTPAAAERLTVELAARAQAPDAAPATNTLPKIEGRPG